MHSESVMPATIRSVHSVSIGMSMRSDEKEKVGRASFRMVFQSYPGGEVSMDGGLKDHGN